jgi:diguanylate cyclase (GGDEF)-like protein/PAS domain S-box-containing protein
VGRGFLDWVHADDLAGVHEAYAAIQRTAGSTVRFTFRCQHANGVWLSLDAIATNLLDNPAVAGLVINARDITDQRQAEDTRRLRERALQRLHEIAVAAGGVLDLPSLGQLVVDSARDLLGADSAGLYWRDEESQELRRIGENDPAHIAVEVVPPGRNVARLAYQDDRVIIVNDYPSWHKADPSASARGMKSAIAVPLRLHRRAVGTLVVRSYTARNFEEEHVHLLQLLAAQLAPVLDGARLHAESERRRTEAEALAELARQGAATTDVNRLTGLISDRACQLLQADFAALLVQTDNDQLVWLGVRGNQSQKWASPRRLAGRGPAALCMAEGRIVVFRSAAHDSDGSLDGLELLNAEGAKTVLAIPLAHADRQLGSLLVGWREDASLTVASGNLAQALAGYAATVLNNAQSHAMSERRRIEAEALAELVRQGATGQTLEDLIRLICDQGSRLVGADYASIALVQADGSWALSGLNACHGQARSRGRGTGPTARAMASGRTIVLERLAEQPDASRFHARQGGQTALATPLVGTGGISGALHLGWRTDVSLSPDQIRLSEAIASYATVILENSRAHTALAERAETLAASQERLRSLYESLTCGILVWDDSSRILQANAAAQELLGRTEGEILGCGPDEFWTRVAEDGTELPFEWRTSNVVSATGEPVRKATVRATSPRGDVRWLQLDVVPVAQPGGPPNEVVASFIDITARKRAEVELQWQAMHDALTGLPNRALINDRLHQAILTARRDGQPLTLMFIDLDRFKDVNDTFGHAYGDILLRQIGPRLQKVLRSSDTVGRLGGDEFAVILPRLSPEDAAIMAQKFSAALTKPVVVRQKVIDVGASIGIASFPEHGGDVQSLMRAADVAMYAAKSRGGTYGVYAADKDPNLSGGVELTTDLRRALEREEIELHYQPKVNCSTGTGARVEALARWRHPNRGLVGPDDFVPLAEQTGLIRPLTKYVLETAARQCREWHDTGLDISVAVNVSIHNLQDPGFPQLVEDLIGRWRLAPAWLRLEVTESTIMADAPELVIKRLRAMGIPLSIDDFGTGYSSLIRLKQLPIDEIKIDKSFVMGTVSNPDDEVIVRSIIDLAHNLGKHVVAEGVETREAWEWLVHAGCDAAQGNYLGAPMPAPELEHWLRTSAWGSRRTACHEPRGRQSPSNPASRILEEDRLVKLPAPIT